MIMLVRMNYRFKKVLHETDDNGCHLVVVDI